MDVPFELEGKLPCSSAVAEAGNIEGSAASRHDGSVAHRPSDD